MSEKKMVGRAFSKEVRCTNPRERSYENETRLISWIYRWGFSTTRILHEIQGVIRSSTIPTIERQGKIVRERTIFKSLPLVYKLTSQGVMVAESRLDENFEYQELTKEKVVTSHFFHDLFTQALTVVGVARGVCVDFATPRMTGLAGKEDKKIPDVVWVNSAGLAFAVEVEVNQKWAEKLDNFFGRIIESIESGEIHECLIVTPSKATARNYLKALDRQEIPVWSRKSGLWRLERNVVVRQIVLDRISVVYVPENEMHQTISTLVANGDLAVWIEEHSIHNTSVLD